MINTIISLIFHIATEEEKKQALKYYKQGIIELQKGVDIIVAGEGFFCR